MNIATRISNLVNVSVPDKQITTVEYKDILVTAAQSYRKHMVAMKMIRDLKPLVRFFPVLADAQATFAFMFSDGSCLFVYSTKHGDNIIDGDHTFGFGVFACSIDDYSFEETCDFVITLARAGWGREDAGRIISEIKEVLRGISS